jgi:Na+/proline symporter
MVLGGFFLYASYYGTDQSQVQRLLAANSLGTVRKTILYNGILRFPVTLSYCVMGLVLGTFAMSQPEFITQIPVDKPDLMIPIFIRDYLPHGIIGLLIVAILSAAMSSLSSAVNSLSAVTTEDFIAHGKNLTHDQYLKYSRWTSLIWGTLCVILAFYTGNIASTVIEAINKIGSVFYGPILATFLAAIQIKKIKARGINVGIVMGVGVNVYFWLVVGDQVFWFWWNLIGAVVTLSTGYLVSLLLPDNSKQASTLSFEKESLFSKDTVLLLFYFALIIITSILIPHLI